MKWKVCGMREAHNIREVLAQKPDFMGFIFYPPSARYVGEDWSLPSMDFQRTAKVGVFVNEPWSSIVEKVHKHKLDYVQLHGDESPQDCRNLYDRGLKVIKAMGISAKEDFEVCTAYKPWVHYFLFDTKTPQYGGSGRTFDWSLLDYYDQEIPFILSGGLDANLDLTIPDHWNLAFIDVNSRFEIKPGLKDVNLLKALKSNLT